MTSSSGKGTFQPDSDVHISYEDQQKINRFARLNAKLEDLKDEIQVKENDLKSLEDACEEISLFDDDEQIPYLVGEVFIYQNVDKTVSCLDSAKDQIGKEISSIKENITKVKDTMAELKAHLYGKFGSHINLEADD